MAVEKTNHSGISYEVRQLLNVKEAARRLNVSASFLNKTRLTGEGPLFIKLGARVAYDPADLTDWLAAQKQASTTKTPL